MLQLEILWKNCHANSKPDGEFYKHLFMSWMMLSLQVMGFLLSRPLFLSLWLPSRAVKLQPEGRKGDLDSSKFRGPYFFAGWLVTASFVREAAGTQGALAISMLMAAPWQRKGGCVRSTPTKAWQRTWGQLWAPAARCHAGVAGRWELPALFRPLLPKFYTGGSLSFRCPPHTVGLLLLPARRAGHLLLEVEDERP